MVARSIGVMLVDATGLRAARPDRALFDDLSLTIDSGDRLAIVGVNGTGKSTLLGALAGSRTPDAGTIRRGRGARIAHLDQDAPLPAGTIASVTGDRWEAAAVRDRLGLSGLEDRPTDQLSGGQIKRVALARALLECGPPGGGPPDDADLLILDEPTNHLDVDAIAWLEEWLSTFRGGLLLVTHDRHVLDRVCNRMLELDRGGAHLHEGGYASYLEAKAERIDRAASAEAKRKNLAQVELAWLRRGAPARTSKPKARIESATAHRRGRAERRRRARPGARAPPGHAAPRRQGDRGPRARRRHRRAAPSSTGSTCCSTPGSASASSAPTASARPPCCGSSPASARPTAAGSTSVPPSASAMFSQDAAELDPAARVRDLVTGGKKEVSWQDTALHGAVLVRQRHPVGAGRHALGR